MEALNIMHNMTKVMTVWFISMMAGSVVDVEIVSYKLYVDMKKFNFSDIQLYMLGNNLVCKRGLNLYCKNYYRK